MFHCGVLLRARVFKLAFRFKHSQTMSTPIGIIGITGSLGLQLAHLFFTSRPVYWDTGSLRFTEKNLAQRDLLMRMEVQHSDFSEESGPEMDLIVAASPSFPNLAAYVQKCLETQRFKRVLYIGSGAQIIPREECHTNSYGAQKASVSFLPHVETLICGFFIRDVPELLAVSGLDAETWVNILQASNVGTLNNAERAYSLSPMSVVLKAVSDWSSQQLEFDRTEAQPYAHIYVCTTYEHTRRHIYDFLHSANVHYSPVKYFPVNRTYSSACELSLHLSIKRAGEFTRDSLWHGILANKAFEFAVKHMPVSAKTHGHGVEHLKAVFANGLVMRTDYANWHLKLLCLILHDVLDHKFVEGMRNETEAALRNFLVYDLLLDVRTAQLISLVVQRVSYSVQMSSPHADAMIFEDRAWLDVLEFVRTADRLEALGLEGIHRTYQVAQMMNADKYAKLQLRTALKLALAADVKRHFEEKILKLFDAMPKTPAVQVIGKPLHDVVTSEYNGLCALLVEGMDVTTPALEDAVNHAFSY